MATTSKPVDFRILKRRLRYGDTIFHGLVLLGALTILATLVAMVWILANQSIDSITHFGSGFFTSSTWNALYCVGPPAGWPKLGLTSTGSVDLALGPIVPAFAV